MGIERLNEFWPEWRVESELGEGAFGKVYKAVDEEAGFPIYSAIKVLSIPSSRAELDALRSEGMTLSESRTYFREIVEGFVNEIKLMHTLKGAPNIVGVEAFKIAEKTDTVGWDIFIRMELLCSFKDYLESCTPSESEIIKLGVDIASALEVCQKENIIHRDIKPANIFVDRYGSFKLGDFGIAKELEKTTGAVSSKGTFSYMAPEVARGMRYDNTVDIYSLGLVLYSLLNNNRPPFVDPYRSEVGYNDRKSANDRRLAGEALPAPCNASSQLSEIILTACSYDPSRRFKSATAFKNALQGYEKNAKAIINTAEIEEKKFDIDETVAIERNPETKPVFEDTTEQANLIFETDEPENDNNDYEIVTNLGSEKRKVAVILCLLILILIASTLIVPFIDLLSDDDSLNDDSIRYETVDISDSGKETPDDASEVIMNDSSSYPEISSTSDVGDTVTFGHYEQDNDSSNGAEEIEWIVLEKKDGKALVISKYALDCQPYNEDYESITWENCTLREWLNDEFYNTAFSEEEKGKIETTYVVNDDSVVYNTEGGNDTRDKVFLLSIDEAETYFSSDEARECEPTTYADEQGVWTDSSTGNCWWWLRSPGYNSDLAAFVDSFGGVDYFGSYVLNSDYAVRPALWINLES